MNGSYDPYPDFSPLYEPTRFSWWLFSPVRLNIIQLELKHRTIPQLNISAHTEFDLFMHCAALTDTDTVCL